MKIRKILFVIILVWISLLGINSVTLASGSNTLTGENRLETGVTISQSSRSNSERRQEREEERFQEDTERVERSQQSHGWNVDPSKYNAQINMDTNGIVVDFASKVLGIINVFGTIILVITVVILGVKYMVGSVEQKADYKRTMAPILIGAFMLFSISSIVNLVYNVVSNLNENRAVAPNIEITEQSQYNDGKEQAITWLQSVQDEEEIDKQVNWAVQQRDKEDENTSNLSKAYWNGYIYGLLNY